MRNLFHFLLLASICSLSLHAVSSKKAVLVGGGLADDNAEIYEAFIKLATPQGKSPYIGLITAASGDPQDSAKFYTNIFQKNFKVKNVEWIPIDLKHLDNADNPELARKIETMTGVFFGGGDQSRLITCFYRHGRNNTLALSAIRRQYEAGNMVIGGTSAGTVIHQKTPMFTGGESWEALAYGSFNHSDPKHPDNLSYDVDGGFGFFTYGFLDTHFGTRGRQGRMVRLIHDLSSYGKVGVGVDEDTAIVMEDNKFKVIGTNGVYLFNLKKTTLETAEPFNLNNVLVSYLTEGDAFDMSTEQVSFADWKSNISGREEHKYLPVSEITDIFSSYNNDEDDRLHPEMFTNATVDLFNAALVNQRSTFTWETTPRFKIDFKKTASSSGVIGYLRGKRYISFKDLNMVISSLPKEAGENSPPKKPRSNNFLRKIEK